MSRVRERFEKARERHARYYLDLAIKAIDTKNHALIEQELDNIRRGWEWVSHISKDLGLVLAYGGLAWQLFDITTSRLNEALREFEKLHLSEHDKAIIKQTLQKVDEILRTQTQMQAALQSKPTYSIYIESGREIAIGDQAKVEISHSNIKVPDNKTSKENNEAS